MVRKHFWLLTSVLLLATAAFPLAGGLVEAGSDPTPPTNPTQFTSTTQRLDHPTTKSSIGVTWPAAGSPGGATDGSVVSGYAYVFT